MAKAIGTYQPNTRKYKKEATVFQLEQNLKVEDKYLKRRKRGKKIISRKPGVITHRVF